MKRLLVLLIILSLILPRGVGQLPETESEKLILSLCNPGDSSCPEAILATANAYCHASIDYSDELFVMLDCMGTKEQLISLEQTLTRIEGVACVERDSTISLMSVTDDYFADGQFWLDNTGSFTKFGGAGPEEIKTKTDIDVDAPEGWAEYNKSTHRKPVVVAVIDTGIDYRHPDLVDAMWHNPGEIPDNGIDDDGNGFVDDVYGWDFYNDDSSVCHYEYSGLHDADLASQTDNDNHGTHCAGIIAATRDNGIGIAGIASVGNIKLMSLKIHGGADRYGTIGSAIKAIRYADAMGADVCNISWGSYLYSASLYTAIAHSHMLFVCAAGNDGTDNDETPLYPACYDLDNIIAVTFTDADGNLAYNSNYGRKSVDIAVPAVDVFSTIVGTYGLMSGSSMAAPQVTAIAAVLYTYGEGLYASNVRDVLLTGVKHLDSCETLMTHPGLASLNGAVLASHGLLYDNELPDVHVFQEFDEDKIRLYFMTDDDGSGICNLRYFTGNRRTSYFKKGTGGSEISERTLVLSKPGTYTFYVDDYAGNATTKTLQITDDWAGPVITGTSLTVNNKQTKLTVSATVYDTQSGLRSVKYLKGCHPAADFKSNSATDLEPDEDGKVKFSVTEEGTYSIYANDMRGNTTVTYVYAYIRKSTAIELNRTRKTLDPEATWALSATVLPARSTDRLTYVSSDENIATVSSRGIVTAVSSGSCTVTVTTSSGRTATCKIKVR